MLDAWTPFLGTLLGIISANQGSETDICKIIPKIGILWLLGIQEDAWFHQADTQSYSGRFWFNRSLHVSRPPISCRSKQGFQVSKLIGLSKTDLFNLSWSIWLTGDTANLLNPTLYREEKKNTPSTGLQLACVFGTHSGIQQDSHIVAASYYNTLASRSTTVRLSFPDVVSLWQLYRKHCERLQIPSKTRL